MNSTGEKFKKMGRRYRNMPPMNLSNRAFNKTTDFRLRADFETKKEELIERLQYEIDHLSAHCNKAELIGDDEVIRGLEGIIGEAKNYELKEIQKTAELAIGKRIFNIELCRKRAEAQNKQSNKRKIEELFRENRINKINYEELAMGKREQNTMIVKPYCNGRGFVESDYFYDKVISPLTGFTYQRAYEGSNYEQVVKQVNKIYFDNFSKYSTEKSRKEAFSSPIMKVLYCAALLMLALCLVAIFGRINAIYTAIFIVSTVLAVLAVVVSVHAFQEETNNHGQLEETISQVKALFEQINEDNRKRKLPYRWNCPDSFLYLEMKVVGDQLITD